ncbi:MAG TPA: hypothetical protein VFT51_00570 [Bacillales bacterium]|nr:hypothetical protein [Bacillales bacterium]
MKKSSSNARRDRAYLSTLGTTQIYLRSPHIVAWWSAAFPGFGHILMSKYIRGLSLFIWEVIINMNAKLNSAMVFSFTGRFEAAKDVLNTRWILLYIPVYLFAIWDSHRTTVDFNKLYLLADHEDANITNFKIQTLEINYLDKREPWIALTWSLLMPGLGQLYIHRVISAFFVLVWWVVLAYFSHFLQALHLIFLGDFHQATVIINPQWMMFMPSVYGFAAYDTYVNTVANNKLFNKEQKGFLRKTYQNPNFLLPKRKR